MTPHPSPDEIATELTRLHAFKDPKYKDAWRKRGELIGIFCNIARKYDRLVVAGDEDDPDAAEPRIDTAADLCVYSIKYLTWLIEHDPTAATAIANANSQRWSGTHGHAAVAAALAQLAKEPAAPPLTLAAAFEAVAEPFTALERILVDQEQVPSSAKVGLAWQLATSSLGYLWRLAQDEPEAWERFETYVANPV